MHVVLAIIVGLLIASALIWTGLRSLKRSADPFAGLHRPAWAEPSTSEGSAPHRLSRLNRNPAPISTMSTTIVPTQKPA